MAKRTLEEVIELLDGAPFDQFEVADILNSCDATQHLAMAFYNAVSDIDSFFEENEIELG